MSNTIRITKTKQLEKILKEIQAHYPLLEEVEIVKMIISEYYVRSKNPHKGDKVSPNQINGNENKSSIKKETKDVKEMPKLPEKLEEADDYITLYDEESRMGL